MSGKSSPTPSERSTVSTVSMRSLSSSVVSSVASSKTEEQPPIFAKARAEAYWGRIDRWERERPGGLDGTRGEWIDECVTRMLAVCEAEGFEVDDEQQLRDDVFDFVRSLSWE